MRCIALLVAALPALVCLNASNGSDKKAKDPKTLRAEYVKLPCKVLPIVEPVELTMVYYWKDGGSIGLVLTDSKKQKHLFCHDHRIEENVSTENIFIGGIHPRRKEAKETKARGPEEQELYAVLLRWIEKHPQRDSFYDPKIELKYEKKDWQLWELRELFLRLDARLTK